MSEIWKAVDGFERYEISSEGRLRTVERSRTGGHNPQVIKPNIKRNGYVQYRLSKNAKYVDKLAHRLVAEAFIPKLRGRKHINHKNGVKHDNRAENLEWVTPSENNLKRNMGTSLLAAHNPNRAVKLTREAATEIRRRHADGVTMARIARDFSISPRTVKDIVDGLSWVW